MMTQQEEQKEENLRVRGVGAQEQSWFQRPRPVTELHWLFPVLQPGRLQEG